jgi:hypothetical protein
MTVAIIITICRCDDAAMTITITMTMERKEIHESPCGNVAGSLPTFVSLASTVTLPSYSLGRAWTSLA